MDEKLAALVTRLRKELDLTQEQAAQLAGVSRDTINRMEAGGEHGFSTVVSVLLALGVTHYDIRAGEPSTPQSQQTPITSEGRWLLEQFEAWDFRKRDALMGIVKVMVAEARPQSGSRPLAEKPAKASRKK